MRTVESLDVSVLVWLAGLDVVKLDALWYSIDDVTRLAAKPRRCGLCPGASGAS